MNQVRVAVLADFSQLVEELGGDSEAILLQHGLTDEFIQVASTDTYMPYEQAESILQAAATSTGCTHFGMLLGKKSGIKLLGTVGYLMLQAKQIDLALAILCEYFSFHVKNAAVVEWRIEGDYASISYRIVTPMKSVTQGVELALANLLSFFHAVHGKKWYPTAVNFTHGRPGNMRPYRHLFGPNVSFGQEENEMILKSTELKNTIEMGEPALRKILERHLEYYTPESQANLSDMVIARIRQCFPLTKPTIKHVAASLNYHPRKLHRVLTQERTSFTMLLESTRSSIALEKLQHSDISIVRLALYLGYSDASAFIRAFRGWTGTTPHRWKIDNAKQRSSVRGKLSLEIGDRR